MKGEIEKRGMGKGREGRARREKGRGGEENEGWWRK